MALFSRRKISSSDEPGSAAETVVASGRSPGNEPTPRRRRTVGQLLRETRESYGSDIPRVAAALRIRASYLEAIENGRYDQLPGAVYAMGFVRAYAVHLGLDGDEAVRRFKLEAEGYDAQRDLAFPVPLSERSIPGWSMLLAALLLAVCGYGLWYYLSSTARPRPERVSPLPAELAAQLPAPPPAAKESAPAAIPSESTAAPAPPTTAPPEAPVAAPAAPTPAPAAEPAAHPAPGGGAGTSATLAPAANSVPTAATTPAAMPVPPAPALPSTPAASASVASPASASLPASPPTAPSSTLPLPPQVAALPSIPPGGGATPVPDQPHVYGLANGETRVLIHAVSDSWIQVRDRDHVPIFTRQLHAGDVYHVPDRPGLSMRTGHGAGLEILVDGRAVPPIGGAVRGNVVLDPNRLLAGNAVGAGE
jgi:cytoskeleton protein RodZ